MLINNNGINSNNLGNSSKLQTNADTNPKANTAVSNTTEGDSVNLSQAGSTLSRLETAVASASDVDTQKVDAIRKAIDEGSYTIDANAIAQKLLADDSLS